MSVVVVVNEVKEVKSGANEKGRWTLYHLVDGNGDRYSTFDGSLYRAAKELEGKRVELDFSENDRGKTFTSIRQAEQSGNGDTPPLGTGEYVTGQKPPIEVRRIFSSTSWNCASALAASVIARQTGQEMTSGRAFEITKSLADAIFTDLLRKGKAMEDSDIPFMPEHEG